MCIRDRLGAAQYGHIAALLFQVVHSTAELGHVGAAALLDVVVNEMCIRDRSCTQHGNQYAGRSVCEDSGRNKPDSPF